MFNGDIFMVCVTEFHRPPLFFIRSLFVCLLSWSRPFAMAENSLVDSGFKGMSCSTPVNPFKAGNPFTSESVSSVDSSMHVEGSGQRFQSAGPFASPLDPSIHGSSQEPITWSLHTCCTLESALSDKELFLKQAFPRN